jgi:hypothetical protein
MRSPADLPCPKKADTLLIPYDGIGNTESRDQFLPALLTPSELEALMTLSRALHGHRYFLPVAAWIVTSETRVVTASEAMVGLQGRADRGRVIEALEKLVGIGAMTELPRAGGQNSPRYFERAEDPYWALVDEYLARLAGRSAVAERQDR